MVFTRGSRPGIQDGVHPLPPVREAAAREDRTLQPAAQLAERNYSPKTSQGLAMLVFSERAVGIPVTDGRIESGRLCLRLLVRCQSDRSLLHEIFVCTPGRALLFGGKLAAARIEFVPIRRRRTAHTTS